MPLPTPPPTPAFRSYFEIFNGHGEVDAQSLENILLLVGISLTTAQVEGALRSADIDGECGAGRGGGCFIPSPGGIKLTRSMRPVQSHGAR